MAAHDAKRRGDPYLTLAAELLSLRVRVSGNQARTDKIALMREVAAAEEPDTVTALKAETHALGVYGALCVGSATGAGLWLWLSDRALNDRSR